MKIRPVRTEFFHADGLTDRHEANRRFSQISEKRLQKFGIIINIKILKICPLLGYCAAMSSSYVSTFRDNLFGTNFSVQEFHDETSVQNYHSGLRNIPEARRSHLHCGISLKSRITMFFFMQYETQGAEEDIWA
jgi:hypothetical protein